MRRRPLISQIDVVSGGPRDLADRRAVGGVFDVDVPPIGALDGSATDHHQLAVYPGGALVVLDGRHGFA